MLTKRQQTIAKKIADLVLRRLIYLNAIFYGEFSKEEHNIQNRLKSLYRGSASKKQAQIFGLLPGNIALKIINIVLFRIIYLLFSFETKPVKRRHWGESIYIWFNRV